MFFSRLGMKLREFISKSSGDKSPWLTKTLTFTLMPLFCCFLFYNAYQYSMYATRTVEQEQFITGTITSVNKIYFSGKRRNNTEGYEIVISLGKQTKTYRLSSSLPHSDEDEDLIVVGAECKLLYEVENGKNRIVELKINNKAVLDLADTNRHFENMRNFVFLMGLLFLVWFLSRIYRYQKYDSLRWSKTEVDKDLLQESGNDR